ncbi:hypothetical protein [Polaribacter sejongensis]|uniref:hypothetical protein n=1 Tax=Polaribacter sejongensis TaxID=985043 RepID=UPI001FCA00BC|nr:hypothetical protein [Polaribacter sejongensis]
MPSAAIKKLVVVLEASLKVISILLAATSLKDSNPLFKNIFSFGILSNSNF